MSLRRWVRTTVKTPAWFVPVVACVGLVALTNNPSAVAMATKSGHGTATGAACAANSSRVGGIGGIQWSRPTSAACVPAKNGGTQLPSPSFRGSPPLTFHGGSTTGTAASPGELTVTPVYWLPTGSSLPASYKTLINQFIADSAADSGKSTNVFSSITQYQTAAGTHLQYKIHTGTPITDTTAFPANGCTPDSGAIYATGAGYSRCITNTQLLNEAKTFTTARGLPHSDMSHLYMYFLPKGLETCFSSVNGAQGGTCSINANGGFCGYHAFSAPPLVADMNYAVVDSPLGWTCSSDAGSNTGGNQTPNANIDADSEISITSHEISETITDPQGNAWYDGSGNENGDDCAYIFGDNLSWGGAGQGAHYNQTINGHHYFIQSEFSNNDFAKNSTYSCILNEDSVTTTPTTGPALTAVTAAGGGYASGETVKVTYTTGLTTPKTVAVCQATTTATGTFACAGHIPAAASTGAKGKHKITASGATSKHTATTVFTLT
jgi:hypothetical protein